MHGFDRFKSIGCEARFVSRFIDSMNRRPKDPVAPTETDHSNSCRNGIVWKEENAVPRIVYYWLVNVLALFVAAALLGGVHVEGPLAGLVAAALLGLINISIRPVLVLVTLPINILTLGLFTFVVNALMLQLVAWLVPGFAIDGFWWAVLAALVLAFVNAVVTRLLPPLGRYY